MTSVVVIIFLHTEKPLLLGYNLPQISIIWLFEITCNKRVWRLKKKGVVVGGAGLLIFNSSFPLLFVKFSVSSRVIFNLKFLDAFAKFQWDCKTTRLWSYQGTVSRKAFWHRSEEERHLEMLHAERAHKWAYLLGGFARFKGTLFISLDSLTLTDHLISH